MKHISQIIPIRRGARHRNALLLGAAILLAAGLQQALGSANHLNLFPKLTTGQTLTYQIAYHSERQAKTHSSVIMAQSPAGADIDVHGLLRLEVLGVEPMGARSVIHARSWFQSLDSATNINVPDILQTPPSQVQKQDPNGIAVEFTISPGGRVDQIQGLDALYPEQQQAWRQWAFRFAATAAFPEKGVQLAQKWKSEEPEKSPSPIANLTWIRESDYVRNEPCRASQLTIQGNVAESAAQPETCAVILTTANLKQKSSSKDATPEDYKLHQLKTTGSASGSNKTLLYISLTTGLLIRSSDHADQSMSVTIAKSDGSNRVRYDVHAKSDTEIFRIANTPLDSK